MSKALSVGLGVPSSPGTYSAALEGLTGVNEVLMRRDPSIPPLYASGARWELKPNDPSETRWRYANEVATDGWGDCQALAAYRAAELRVNGTDPAAHVRVYPTGPNKYHAVVARGDGRVEDPSVALGMMPFPGAPMSNNELPAVQGPSGGYPGGGSPGLDPDAIMGAQRQVARSVAGLHPHAAICGVGCLGDETGVAPKLARVKDVAPEFYGPTFHVVGHARGSKRGWKGVHRVPLNDGTAIVGMTRTHKHPADCIGDGTSLISDIGHAISRNPILLAALSPFSAGTTLALMDPSVQHALGSVGRTVKNAVDKKGPAKPSNGNQSSDSGWPSDWGDSVTGAPGQLSENDKAVVGWGLSNLASIVTDPLRAAGNLISHPSLTNLAKLGISPLTGAMHTIYRPSSGGGTATYRPASGAPSMAAGMPFQMPTAGTLLSSPQPFAGWQGAASGFAPGFPPGFNPMAPQQGAPQYVPPGYNPASYQPPQQFNPDPAAWNAPTAADYGLPIPGSGMEGSSESQDLSVAFSDPTSAAAFQTYANPGAGIGYWNT